MLLPVIIYLPDYYARELGVDLAVLASTMMLVRLFDLWFDPFLGFVMDRTNSRFGRYRPWFVAGAPIGMLALWMLFNAKPGIGGGYLLFWLIAGYVGQSMSQLGHMAWAASTATSYDKRSSVYGSILVFSILGTFAIMAMPPVMRLVFHAEPAASVQSMGWFVMLVLPVTIVIALLAAPEPRRPPAAGKATFKGYVDLLRRGSVLRLLGADIAWGTGPAIAATLIFTYLDSIKGFDRSTGGLLLLVYFVGGMAGAPFWTMLSKKVGKHRALMGAGFCYAIVQCVMLMTPGGSLPLIVAGMFLSGLPSTAGQILLRSMMADLADEDRLISGVDRTALMFALLSGSVKIGSALAVGVGLYSLKLVGFDFALGRNNPETALLTLSLAYTLVPAALGLLTAWIISGHRLDASAHAEVRRQLDERDARLERAAAQ